LRVDPRDGSARKNLGLLYLQLGDLDRARAVLAQAVADDPRHVVALLYLGVLEERAGRGAAALAHYTAALVIAGSAGSGWMMRTRPRASWARWPARAAWSAPIAPPSPTACSPRSGSATAPRPLRAWRAAWTTCSGA